MILIRIIYFSDKLGCGMGECTSTTMKHARTRSESRYSIRLFEAIELFILILETIAVGAEWTACVAI